MPDLYRKILALVRKFQRIFQIRFDKAPLVTVDALVEFIHTRSAYVAQTSLYGYLKTRMGREYVTIFKDEKFAPSLNKAKWEIYAACLSDLTICAVANAGWRSAEQSAELAFHCYQRCVRTTFDGEIAEAIAEDAVARFAERIEGVVWANAAIGALAFSRSPEALADSSPVTDEYKKLDREIVMNSIRFRWIDVREQLNNRLDGEAIWQDWNEISASLKTESLRTGAITDQKTESPC